jgi:hypothetical protein
MKIATTVGIRMTVRTTITIIIATIEIRITLGITIRIRTTITITTIAM